MAVLRGTGRFIGVALPSLFLLFWAVDAPLLVGRDVFLLALLQAVFIGVFLWRWHAPPSTHSKSE